MHNISFPKLGLDFNLNPEAFSIGNITVYWYGIIMALAFLAIILGVLKDSEKYGLRQDDLIDLLLITTPIGIVCARIFYVLLNWDYYKNNLSEIYKIWHGGLAIYGGIIGGLITIYLFCRSRKISTLKLLDHIVVYLVLGQVIGRWGNFVNQELFGPNTDLPWGMTGDLIRDRITRSPSEFPGVDPNLPVHPLFLYESLWNLAAFFVLLWFRKRKKLDGEVFSLYMVSYGMARFVIDSLRFDLKIGDINANRVLGLLFAVAFVIVFIVRRIRLKNKSGSDGEYEPSIYSEILSEIEDKSSDIDMAAEGSGTEAEELKNTDNGMDKQNDNAQNEKPENSTDNEENDNTQNSADSGNENPNN